MTNLTSSNKLNFLFIPFYLTYTSSH